MADPLLLIPGMMCDARIFLPQISEFSFERPVLIACLAGCETIEDMAAQVLKTAPPKFALAGLSMGAMVAMEIARMAPKRVMRLALMDTNSQAETPAVAASREPDIVKVLAGRLPEVMVDMMRPQYLAAGPTREPILRLFQEMALTMGEGDFVRHSRALQRRPDQQKTLRKISCPTLVLCGEEDTLTPPKRHEFMADLIPNSTLKIIESAGHLPTLEAPLATNEALQEWLWGTLVLA